MKKNYPYLCGVDWLTIFGHCDPLATSTFQGWKVIATDFPTPQYKKKALVYCPDDAKCAFCEILFAPSLSVMDVRSCHLRILNKHLYSRGWYSKLLFVLSALRIEYRSITRIDLFYDCNTFKYGRKPIGLALDYISRKVLKIGINRGTIAFKDYGYAIAENTRKEAVAVSVGVPNVNAITWGNKGYVQTQLYNKTLELKEKAYKEHIVKAWEARGINPDGVWRTEIRIQKQGLSLKLLDSGDLWSLGPDDVSNNERIYECFLAYAKKYMRFVVADYHRKKQQMQPVDLWSYSEDIQQVIAPKIAPTSSSSFREARRINTFLRALGSAIDSGDIVLPDKLSADKLFAAAGVIHKLLPPEWMGQLYRPQPGEKVKRTATIRRLHQRNLRQQFIEDAFRQGCGNRQANWLLSPQGSTPKAQRAAE